MRSSVPAFKAALLARLKADPAITGNDLMVSRGNPYPDQESGELIVIGGVTNRRLDFVCGMTQANETYDVEVVISVVGATVNDMDTREERTYELADAVADSTRRWGDGDDPFPAGDWGQINDVTPVESHDQDALVSGTGRECAVLWTLSVRARV